jgi:lipopolysaccharide assembly protein B
VTDSALLATLLAALSGLAAGRAWAKARRRDLDGRHAFRSSSHYMQGLHYLAAGQSELAASELSKVVREEPEAFEIQIVLGNLQRQTGQVEKAMQAHQTLLARADLSRADRAHALVCLGLDQRAAGFIDRAQQTFQDVLDMDPKNIHALAGLQKLHEEQRRWREAFEVETRLARLRKADASLVLGHIQAEIGRESLASGHLDEAEKAFKTALALDRRVFPAHLGLSDLALPRDPRRAAALLQDAIAVAPERAYLAFERLARAFNASGEPSRFVALCEEILTRDPRDWRARLALARHLRGAGRPEEAYGLLLRALAENPHVLLVHLETWRTLRDLGVRDEHVERYSRACEESVFYRDPHICTACRYRADDMLWRCPHCHEWNTFVEERLGPTAGTP